MDINRESGFKFYSLGIVIVDKMRTTDYIKVLPIESISDFDGDLNSLKKDLSVGLVDSKGSPISSKISSDTFIYAKWLPLSNSNRSTSPDVIKNETVIIYRFSDSQDYYWSTMFDEPNIRRLETVRYSYGNRRDPLTKYDENSSYWFEVSTHDKYIHLHTSNNDGEAVKYDVKIDTKKGTITIQDNNNNSVILDSVPRKITANSKTLEINMDSEVVINTQTATVNASSQMNINTPTLNISQNVNIGGNVNVKGNVTAPRFIGTATRADSAATADCC